LELKENIRKQIILELKTLHKTQCEQVVAFYDAFYEEGSILIALEYMDAGSLSEVLSKSGPIPENIMAKITKQVLQGLNYLHKKLHLIHRDIKPSNILINKAGQVKISDFGVSGQLAHTLSQCASWVGTVTYMSPERIRGSSYSYDSDIWSLGLALLECALGHYPYEKPVNNNNSNNKTGNNSNNQSTNHNNQEGGGFQFWELVELIIKEDPPSPSRSKFSAEFCSFIDQW
jgi:serine/threonine protein kinase